MTRGDRLKAIRDVFSICEPDCQLSGQEHADATWLLSQLTNAEKVVEAARKGDWLAVVAAIQAYDADAGGGE